MVRVGDAFGHDVFYEVGGAGVEASLGDLRDDLGDIYIDLRRGLAIIESNASCGVARKRREHIDPNEECLPGPSSNWKAISMTVMIGRSA